MFEDCRQLLISFSLHVSNSPTGYRFVLQDLLYHFPAVRVLKLTGDHLPLLGRLPAPEKLRKMRINFILPYEPINMMKNRNQQVVPIVANFSELIQLGLGTVKARIAAFGVKALSPDRNIDEATMRYLTGVNWSESFARHPLASLEDVSVSTLNSWTINLLANCAATCRTLTILQLTDDSKPVKELLRERAAGGGEALRNVTDLTIEHFTCELDTCQILALTPSLETLRFSVTPREVDVCVSDVKCPLRALTKVIFDESECFHEGLRLGWLRSIRRMASHAGLKIYKNGCQLNV